MGIKEKYCHDDSCPVCGKPKAPKGLCQLMADNYGNHCEEPARYRIIMPWDELLTCSEHFHIGFGEMVSPSSDGQAKVEFYNE